MKLIALVAATVLLVTAPAALAKTVIFTDAHGGDFVSKPEKLKYSNEDTGGQGLLKVKNLGWSNWGDGKATSPATVKLCNADGNECFTTSDASVKAKKRQELDSIGYYTKLVVYFGQNAIKFSLPTP
jgi:hypothetical protein